MREPFHIEDFVAAGYFIGLPGGAAPGAEAHVTAAGPHFPDLPRHLSGEAAPNPVLDHAFGLDPRRMDELRPWLKRQEGIWIGWDDVCYSAEVAADLIKRFLDPEQGAFVFGLACPRPWVASFLEATAVGGKTRPEPGVRVMLKSEAQMEAGGVPLGFEPLALQGMHLLTREDTQDETVPERNSYGLFDDPAEAVPESTGGTGLWFPLLLLRYA